MAGFVPGYVSGGDGGGGGANQNIVAGTGLSGGGNQDSVTLNVVRPFTAVEQSNLAKLYPRSLSQQGSYIGGSQTGEASEMRLNDSSGNLIATAGGFDRVKQIIVNVKSGTYDQRASDPYNSDNNVNWKALYDKIVDAAPPSATIRIELNNSDQTTTHAASYRILSATFTDNAGNPTDDDWYTFTLGAPFKEVGEMVAGSGNDWNVTVSFDRRKVLGSQIEGMDVRNLDASQIYKVLVEDASGTFYKTDFANFVKLRDLKPKESDFWSGYDDDILNATILDKTEAITITSDTSGPPQNANAYRRFDLVPDNTTVTVWVSTTQFGGSDFNNFDHPPPEQTIAVSDIGDELYIHFNDTPKNYIKFDVVSGSATTLGSGRAAGIYFRATTTIVGTLAQQFDDLVAIRDEIPSDFWDGVEIPKSAIVGLGPEKFTDWTPTLQNLAGADTLTQHFVEYIHYVSGNGHYVIIRLSMTASHSSNANFQALRFDLPPVPDTGTTPSRLTCFVNSIDNNFSAGQCGIVSNKVRVIVAKKANDGNNVSFDVEIHYKTN